jgi:hypothetical protein
LRFIVGTSFLLPSGAVVTAVNLVFVHITVVRNVCLITFDLHVVKGRCSLFLRITQVQMQMLLSLAISFSKVVTG